MSTIPTPILTRDITSLPRPELEAKHHGLLDWATTSLSVSTRLLEGLQNSEKAYRALEEEKRALTDELLALKSGTGSGQSSGWKGKGKEVQVKRAGSPNDGDDEYDKKDNGKTSKHLEDSGYEEYYGEISDGDLLMHLDQLSCSK